MKSVRAAGEVMDRSSDDPVLEVTDLQVEIRGHDKAYQAVKTVSFSVMTGQTLGIVGESGSGKSLTARAVMGLLPPPMVQFAGGDVRLGGRSLIGLGEKALSQIRGSELSMIFQDPLSSLNPVMRVGDQVAEVVRIHRRCSRSEALETAVGLMDRVGIPSAAQRARAYPHQFSGGMRQRVMIAIAIAMKPKVLIADEPTTALDVTVQAQILDLLAEMQEEMGMALLMITHDLSVVADVADCVAVMYSGRLVETGSVTDIFSRPTHPYTQMLLESMPRLDRTASDLAPMRGRPPALGAEIHGCAFQPRCPYASQRCEVEVPELRSVAGTQSACHFAEQILRSNDVR